jgi:signal transduction histidine kinase
MLSANTKIVIIIVILLIIAISYGLYFYLQDITEAKIRDAMLQQQIDRQLDSVKAISKHIASDLESIVLRLRLLANSPSLIQGDLTGISARGLLNMTFRELNNITVIDSLDILDKNGVPILAAGSNSQIQGVDKDFVGPTNETNTNANTLSDTSQPRKRELVTMFSGGFYGNDGTFKIALTYPIVDTGTGESQGYLRASIPTVDFFKRYGNIYNISSQYLAALDDRGVQLAHGNNKLIGKNFFDGYTQNFTKHNSALNNLMHRVISGESGYALYDIPLAGERITTGSPITLNIDDGLDSIGINNAISASPGGDQSGNPLVPYVLFIITPNSAIYSNVNDILFTQRTETFALLGAITSAVIVLIIFLIRWNRSLDVEVKKRTRELDQANNRLSESNKQLSIANELLRSHDKIQKEFINIAAHELRTPTQAIVGYSELLQSSVDWINLKVILRGDLVEYINSINRNAGRLQILTNNILDVTRIESGTLKLRKEKIDLNEKIRDIIRDITTSNKHVKDKGIQINFDEHNLSYLSSSSSSPTPTVFVEADRSRLYQVLTNLINNSVKFSDNNGTITISIEPVSSSINDRSSGGGMNDTKTNEGHVKGAGDEIIIRVKDTGMGIDKDLMSMLFEKFATKSGHGTGLGLFIAKSIVEAHGGRIWARNNDDGKGATFSFTLHLSDG